MKIAIVHEWLTSFVGSEHVLEQFLLLFPQADLFCLVEFLPPDQRGFLHGKQPHTSFIQRLPLARRHYRQYLPLMPLAIEQFDLADYDLVISNSHAVAKGVLVGPDQLHISYVHTPIRYAWDLQHQYLEEANLTSGVKSWITRAMLHQIRIWDYRTANGVDHFLANSNFVARRIWKIYRREAKVIYPPVNTEEFQLKENKEDFYLTASRLVPYKKVDLIVKAFASMPDKRLVVVGDGPDLYKVKAAAKNNVEVLGYQQTKALIDLMQRARAFIFTAVEDFGIMPLEAQACGTPVIAYNKGGVIETIQDLPKEKPTGLFFSQQNVSAIIEAVSQFEQVGERRITPQACRENAIRFSQQRFRMEFMAFIDEKWSTFLKEKNIF